MQTTFQSHWVAVVLLTVGLAGCATAPPPRPAPQPSPSGVVGPVPVPARPAPPVVTPPAPPAVKPPPTVVKPPPAAPKPAKSSVPAVNSLLAQAEKERDAGKLDDAIATAERAVRVSPRDAKAWTLLAELRGGKGEWPVAEQLARRALALASSDPNIAARNWRLIAEARRQVGDEAGAAEAEAKTRPAS